MYQAIVYMFISHDIHTLYAKHRRTVISGGGSLASHLDDFFEIIGLPVLNGWGLTETSPVLACRNTNTVREIFVVGMHVLVACLSLCHIQLCISAC